MSIICFVNICAYGGRGTLQLIYERVVTFYMPSHILITLTAKSVDRSRSFESAIVTPPFCRYYIINSIFFQVKYSAFAECEIIFCVFEVVLRVFDLSWNILPYGKMWNNFLAEIVKYLPPPTALVDVKWNSPPHICEANISQRSYFTWRSQISLAEGEFHWKKPSRNSTWLFSWHTLTK